MTDCLGYLERIAGWTSIRILGLQSARQKLDSTSIIMTYHHKGQIQVEEASRVWGYLSLDFALSYKRVMAALKESRGPLMMT